MVKSSVGKPEMGDDAIRAGAGKDWREWVVALDGWNASTKSHAEIAAYVGELGVSDWWSQSVAVGYERIKGLRDVGQRRDGSFQGSASKTLATPVSRLFAAWVDESERNRWLAPGTLSLRTTKSGRSARFDSAEGIVALWFTDKGAVKSSVSINVEGLATRADADGFRQLWKQRFADLAAYLDRIMD